MMEGEFAGGKSMAEKQELDIQFTNYAERMNQVCVLSTPSLDEVENADDYSRLLLYNFKKIGELAGENREMIDQVFMPLINKEEPLSEDEIEALEALNALLINVTEENPTDLDIHLAELANERIERDRDAGDCVEETDGDVASTDARIRMLDKNIDIYSHKMLECARSYNFEEAKQVQKRGLACYREILSYLEKDRYLALSETSKRTVLVDTYFGANLYDCFDERKMIEQLAYARSILEEPFYREGLTDWEPEVHIYHTYEYVAMMCYYDGYKDPQTYRDAYENALIAQKIWMSDPERYEKLMRKETIEILCLYGAARIQDPSLADRLAEAIKLYEGRDMYDYSLQGLTANQENASMLFDVIEIARKNQKHGFREEFLRVQRQIPHDFVSYLYRTNNLKLANWYLGSIGNLVEAFREVPGGMKGGELFRKVVVAMHPPTYVHSYMVAKLSMCLVRHVLEWRPEYFVTFPGCGDVETVLAKKDEIVEYAYQAALYHDIGKLMILDTIAMYGRRLLDTEFRMLKTHPDNGARIAERLPSLRPYADVIRGHHVWYDGSHGYPVDFHTAESPYKTVIDVVMAADCLDAATDRVGRSYSVGKTLEEYQGEVRNGAGTRYAPWLPEIMESPRVEEDVRCLLTEGRKQIYRETFQLLKEISQMRQ